MNESTKVADGGQSLQPAARNRNEVEAMAQVLEARHGMRAAAIADFFSEIHVRTKDAVRSRAWESVATVIRRREAERIGDL